MPKTCFYERHFAVNVFLKSALLCKGAPAFTLDDVYISKPNCCKSISSLLHALDLF